jgi:formate hydrogenlyase transcriptional activator
VLGKSVNVRIIAATNADVSEAIAAGRFRSDLYYRLHVFPIVMPPLRERVPDIPVLVRHFMEKNCLQFQRGILEIDERSMERLLQYSWPGNVRELKNVIERAMILSPSTVLHVDEALLRPESQERGTVLPSTQLKDLELATIRHALDACEWRIDGPLGAAKYLGLHHSTLRSRLKKLGITRKPVLS